MMDSSTSEVLTRIIEDTIQGIGKTLQDKVDKISDSVARLEAATAERDKQVARIERKLEGIDEEKHKTPCPGLVALRRDFEDRTKDCDHRIEKRSDIWSTRVWGIIMVVISALVGAAIAGAL